MRYNDELIEEIRSRNDIVDVISGYVKLQRKGASYFGLCPFHNEKAGSFSVSPAKQMFYCFGCQTGGNVITFLMKYENYSFAEALKVLAERAGIALPEPDVSREAKERENKRRELLDIQKQAAGYFFHKLHTPAGQNALSYLKGRGLDDEIIRSFGLGYADKFSNDLYKYLKSKEWSDELLLDSGLFSFDEKKGFHDKFWNRVMFPIMDANSRVIGFGGRVMGDAKPKYLNSPETEIFDKSRNLYGLHVARRTRRKFFLVCEGYMDVISMHQAGYTNAVASLGTALTSQHCSLLSRFTKEVMLLYDMDEAGTRAALRAIPMLRNSGIRAKVVDLSPYKDPDEFLKKEGAEAFEGRLKRAENSFLFEIRMLEREYEISDPQGKSDFLHEAAARIMELSDDIERRAYADTIAPKYGVTPDELMKLVGKKAMAAVGRKPIRIPENPAKQRAERATGLEQSQRLLLTWLANEPGLAKKLSAYLSPADFPKPLYRQVAELLYEQESRGEVSPAGIISHFEDEAEQTEVAALFHTELPLEREEDKRKAIGDVLFRLKEAGFKNRMAKADPNNIEEKKNLTAERKKLDKLRAEGLPKQILKQ